MDTEDIKLNIPCLPEKPCSVLVIDDDRASLEIVETYLNHYSFDVTTAESGEEAWEKINIQAPDIILLDILMPVVSGFDLLRQIRESPKTQNIPVILISALGDTDHVVKGLEQGANDYIVKPINMSILLARMQTHIRISFLVKRLEMQTKMLSRMAALDDLTGIYNRRSMNQILEMELTRSKRYKHFLSLLMMDIDHFKSINDEYGHATGDHVLQEFVARVNITLRTNDILCRYGGEEFCVILPETNKENAMKVADRICSSIQHPPFSHENILFHLSVSIGIASLSPHVDLTPEKILQNADLALYEAKRKGRNCISFIDLCEEQANK